MATTTTAQSVISASQADARNEISNTNQVLEYVSRVQEQLLRASAWQFLLSPIQEFITQEDQTDYWFGAIGTGPLTAVDTGLNLSNVGRIVEGEVFDRSNFRDLARTSEAPLLARLSQQDSSSRSGRPAVWRNDVDSPSVISIYPAPDNENTYQSVPEAPICQAV